jgi:hypothetical protein
MKHFIAFLLFGFLGGVLSAENLNQNYVYYYHCERLSDAMLNEFNTRGFTAWTADAAYVSCLQFPRKGALPILEHQISADEVFGYLLGIRALAPQLPIDAIIHRINEKGLIFYIYENVYKQYFFIYIIQQHPR